ncbi:hypothetical protein DL546_006717 [Coniochaeta pulveracea]|uniref:MARVEL domain-containing protein n=1 Tax=Coniochaeta pulveracea TaxID=177199 RepID=A0A420YI36_9PEZI|nr:hypothetical protein DL546_006717 [Coniochaeta pulveracea]
MAMDIAVIATDKTVVLALRALQFIFSIIVIGTDSYAIHKAGKFTQVDNAYMVPSSWGYFMFCAVWTFLVVIFLVVAEWRFQEHLLVAIARVALDVVTLFFWFGGFIAVATGLDARSCPAGNTFCSSIKTATVFGAFDWLLFVMTAVPAVMLVWYSYRRPKDTGKGATSAV